jgi:hypothetical protein
MIRKLAPALLLTSLSGCLTVTPGSGGDPAAVAVPPPPVPALKNGWSPPEAFTMRGPTAAGGTLPGTAVASTTTAAKPLARPTADASRNRRSAEEVSEGGAEESEAAPAQPETSVADALPAESAPEDAVDLRAPVHRLVNTRRIALGYEVKNVGPSGVSNVEVWSTRDGRTWKKYESVPQGRSPLTVEVPEEGLYGFTLVARNGAGSGKRPPRAGDVPQVSVEVDLTRPAVRLLGAEPEVGADDRRLVVSWRASDRNLGPRPITLAYAEQAEGPWEPIAAGLENTGRYAWKLPAGAPPRFLLRVEATDLAGNVGVAQTPAPILMDQSQPEVSIRTVEPAATRPR